MKREWFTAWPGLPIAFFGVLLQLAATIYGDVQERQQQDVEDREGRLYHHLTIASVARTMWTHIETDGKVTLVRHEPDGDVHIRLEDDQHRFVVVEVIPAISLTIPKVGDVVRVRGIHRYDGRHRFHEVHPAESIEIRPQRQP